MQASTSFTFSHDALALAHDIAEVPVDAAAAQTRTDAPKESVPLDAFRHKASAMQAIARYLVDNRKLSFAQAARILGRSPKSIWASYHQTAALPAIDENTLRIPVDIFTGARPPLEALVAHLRSTGLRNAEIARILGLDPRTTWTAAKRAEVRA